MANTVTLLSYANTFGDWVVTTNALVQENNNLAANNYIKPTGTLYLNGPTLGLQVANNAVVAGQLQVQGTGSSAYIQNNMRVDQQVYFTNTTLGLVNSGQANIGGPLLALGANNGLQVSNNAIVGGNVIISGSEIIGGTLNVTGNTTVNGSITVANNSTFTNNLAVLVAITSPSITGSVSVTTPTLNVLSSGAVAGNFNVGGPLLALGANDGLQVSNNATVGGNVIISGSEFVGGNVIISGSEFIGGTLSVTGNTTVNGSITVANNSTFTNNVAVLGSITSPSITGSVSVTTPTLTVLNGATVYGQLQVAGNFVLTGATVYSTNTFTLNANSNAGITSTFGVNRGVNANAAIRWNESTQYWDIRDVNNPTSYSQILTANLVSNSLTSQLSSPYAASQLAANTLYTYLTSNVSSLQSQITNNTTSLQSQISNNTSSLQSQITSNVNSINANTANLSAYLTSNVSSLQSQISSNVSSLQSQISSNVSYISSVDAAQNTYAQASFSRANASSNIFSGTTGTAIPSSGNITFASNNGVAVSATGNYLYINDPQDLRSTASPTFNGLTLSNALPISQGGTGTTSSGQALTNLLPTGTTAGYVLTTGGPGTFYWSAGGSGGSGTTPGTTINSTRTVYTANGSGFAYTTPSYIPGASQLRVYIDGVRQFPSEYTETSNTVCTFFTSPPASSVVLFEVDGYIINPYYANNIAYTVNSTISPSANTIQLAIDGLTSIVALKSGTTFTGVVQAPTATIATSNTQVATTAFVNNVLGSGGTYGINISGNALNATTAVNQSGGTVNATTGNFSGLVQQSGDLGSGPNFAMRGTSAGRISFYDVKDPDSGIYNYNMVMDGGAITFNYSTTNSAYDVGAVKYTFDYVGNFTAVANITAYSDERLKKNWRNLPTDFVDQLSKVKNGIYDRIDENVTQVGVSAQSLQQVMPEAVMEDKEGTLSVAYGNAALAAVIELSKEIVKLRAEIDTLKGSK